MWVLPVPGGPYRSSPLLAVAAQHLGMLGHPGHVPLDALEAGRRQHHLLGRHLGPGQEGHATRLGAEAGLVEGHHLAPQHRVLGGQLAGLLDQGGGEFTVGGDDLDGAVLLPIATVRLPLQDADGRVPVPVQPDAVPDRPTPLIGPDRHADVVDLPHGEVGGLVAEEVAEAVVEPHLPTRHTELAPVGVLLGEHAQRLVPVRVAVARHLFADDRHVGDRAAQEVGDDRAEPHSRSCALRPFGQLREAAEGAQEGHQVVGHGGGVGRGVVQGDRSHAATLPAPSDSSAGGNRGAC